MKKGLILSSVLVIISLLISYTVSAKSIFRPEIPLVKASEYVVPLDDCYSLDVIFIVDQSGSMSGDAGAAPNDPIGSRFEAPRYAMDWLANN